MSMIVREGSTADREAVLALRGRCFPEEDPEKRDPRFWDWEFRHGRLFVAEVGSRVIAHLGFMAQTHILRGARVPSLLAVDAMTDPEFRGRGVFGRVARFAGETIRSGAAFSNAWQIREAVRGGMAAGGWTPGGGARVQIRPLAALRPRGRGDGAATSDAAAMADIAHDFLVDAYVERTAAWLRRRYLEHPLWSYDVSATEGAWLVTRRTRLKGFDTLAIVDVAWRRGCAGEASALLVRALRTARTTLAAALVTRAHPAFGWLLRHGFFPGPYRFHLLTLGIDAQPRWQLAWGDTDHL